MTALIYFDRQSQPAGWAYRATPVQHRIVTVSGRGLPATVDDEGYDTRLAAEAMAEAEHDGEYRIESYEAPEESGEFGGALDEEAPLRRMLDAPDLPRALRDIPESQWRPVSYDGPGWEVRS